MADKIINMEERIVHFLQESLDELCVISQEESAHLENVKARTASLILDLRRLATDIDGLSKAYDQSRTELMEYSRDGLLTEEKNAYQRASELMTKRASLEERYRLLSQRKDELLQEERALSRLVSKSEKMGNRLRMVMHLVSLPEDIEGIQERLHDSEALSTAFRIAEWESRSFARELHDGPTQTFSAVGLTLEMVNEQLNRGDPAAASSELQLSLSELRSGLSEIRSLLFSLNPTGIEEGFDLPLQRLKSQVHQIWKAELTYHLTGKLEDVPGSVRVGIFKTVHQAVLNAARAGASKIVVSLGFSRKALRARIVDNGEGFDVELEKQAAKERGSYGLLNMEERVEIFGGKLSVSSAPEKGTTVSFSIPLFMENK